MAIAATLLSGASCGRVWPSLRSSLSRVVSLGASPPRLLWRLSVRGPPYRREVLRRLRRVLTGFTRAASRFVTRHFTGLGAGGAVPSLVIAWYFSPHLSDDTGWFGCFNSPV